MATLRLTLDSVFLLRATVAVSFHPFSLPTSFSFLPTRHYHDKEEASHEIFESALSPLFLSLYAVASVESVLHAPSTCGISPLLHFTSRYRRKIYRKAHYLHFTDVNGIVAGDGWLNYPERGCFFSWDYLDRLSTAIMFNNVILLGQSRELCAMFLSVLCDSKIAKCRRKSGNEIRKEKLLTLVLLIWLLKRVTKFTVAYKTREVDIVSFLVDFLVDCFPNIKDYNVKCIR